MQRTLTLAISAAILCTQGLFAGEKELKESLTKTIKSSKTPPAVQAFVTEKLVPNCTNTILVAEVEKQNGKKVSLDEIKKIDKEWTNAEEPLPIQDEKTSNACAKELKKIIKDNSVIVEVFVMDNQGANVGQNDLTSDYWQGDEDKWKNSFNNGKGGVDIGKAKFDRSANTVLQQISLPIINKKGEVVGAVTYGIAVDKLK